MIYVHVPFCRSFCTYCGFYSETVSGRAGGEDEKALFSSFADEICSEASSRRSEILASSDSSKGFVNTLYIGGGTPSVLPLDVLERIVSGVGEGLPDFEEFTVEVNPEDILERGTGYLYALKSIGVTRLSLGVQSFNDRILRWMNRRHDAATAADAIREAQRAGFDNLSIDLIFGLSQLSLEEWRDTVDKAISLSPAHVSAYQLSVEKGSELSRMIHRGEYETAGDEQCREQYDLLCEMLGSAGYHHYEVSNFSMPGYEAVHNSAYWRRVPYVGLGPGAHSLVGGNLRRWNTRRISNYKAVEEHLTEKEIEEEEIMLGLRTDKGVDSRRLVDISDTSQLPLLLSKGALVNVGDRTRIPEDHFFVSDDIISDLIK